VVAMTTAHQWLDLAARALDFERKKMVGLLSLRKIKVGIPKQFLQRTRPRNRETGLSNKFLVP
jgi:hypothetical protein